MLHVVEKQITFVRHIPHAKHGHASVISRRFLARAVVACSQQLTQCDHRPPLRIAGRVTEHIQEQRGHQFCGFALGFAAQADNAFGAGEQINDALLFLSGGTGICAALMSDVGSEGKLVVCA